MAIISAFYLLLIVLRRYKRIRTEHNLENLVQIEVDRSLKSTGEFRDQQVLRERLKHAIAMLRTDRSAGGGGSSALYDLPWYLVIGMSRRRQDLAADPFGPVCEHCQQRQRTSKRHPALRLVLQP